MKIVRASNYDNETVSDMLIAENVDSRYADDIVKFLNDDVNDYSPYYYKAVSDDYELYSWEP